MIFSGKGSKKLWKSINRIGKISGKKRKKLSGRTALAVYLLGCDCQNLEAQVLKQGLRIEALERLVKMGKMGDS